MAPWSFGSPIRCCRSLSASSTAAMMALAAASDPFGKRIAGQPVRGRWSAPCNSVSPQDEHRTRALGLVRHDHCEFAATRLCLANQAQSGLPVAPRRIKHDVEILLRIRIEERFLEERYAAAEDRVSHDNQAAVVGFLVLPDQLLALIPGSVSRFIERRASRHRLNCMGGPCMSNVEDLLPRAFLVSSRQRLAISIRSRQSGSMPGGGGNSVGDEPAEARWLLVGPVCRSDTLFIRLKESCPAYSEVDHLS